VKIKNYMKKLLLISFVCAFIGNANAQIIFEEEIIGKDTAVNTNINYVSNTDLLASYKFEQNVNASNASSFNGTVNGTVTYDTKNSSALSISNTVGINQCDGIWQTTCTGGYSKGKCQEWGQVCSGTLVNSPASNNYVSLPISNTAIADKFTISFWLNPQQNNSFPWNNIISKRLNKSTGKSVLYNSINISISNSTTLYAGISTTNDTEINLTTPITTGTWTYITYTYDGSNVKLYKNGVLAAESAATGSVEFNTSTKWVLGQMSDLDNSQGGNFSIDDLHIFTRTLSANEVSDLQNSGVTAIEDDFSTSKYTISPNPANDIVNLPGQGTIYDLVGNKVAEGEGNVSISHLEAGIYLVKIGVFTQKLVKN
jgi:hypothetical protein